MKQKIVITGAPGTGKTSVINKLEKDNFFCLHEIIRTMTLEAKEKGNPSAFKSNPLTFVSDPMEFNKKILKGRIDQFIKSNEIGEPLIFFDRAIPDVLAYMDFFNQKYDSKFIKACKIHTYDKVFLLPPWEDIYISDNERLESYEEAKQIHFHLENTYKNFGYDLIEVPFGAVNERVNFILNAIK